LKTVPPIDKHSRKSLTDFLKEIKNKEKKKAGVGGYSNFDKIKIIDDFLELR
jgi:hypothetical protein